MARRFGHEKVDNAEKFEPFERRPRVIGIRQRHQGIETDAQQPADLPTVDGLAHLGGGVANARQDVFGHTPTLGNNAAVLWIIDVPPARQLVTALPVLAPALAIALASNGRVTTARLTDLAGGQDQIDARQAVLRPLRVVLDAAGV